jgi:hypothetical protein
MTKGGCADAVGEEDDGGGPLKLGLPEGDEEGWAESLGEADGKLECLAEGSDDGHLRS